MYKACRHSSFVGAVGENIFMSEGYAGASTAVDGWMDSAGYRANILSQIWEREDIGVSSSKYGTYFVQMFCS